VEGGPEFWGRHQGPSAGPCLGPACGHMLVRARLMSGRSIAVQVVNANFSEAQNHARVIWVQDCCIRGAGHRVYRNHVDIAAWYASDFTGALLKAWNLSLVGRIPGCWNQCRLARTNGTETAGSVISAASLTALMSRAGKRLSPSDTRYN